MKKTQPQIPMDRPTWQSQYGLEFSVLETESQVKAINSHQEIDLAHRDDHYHFLYLRAASVLLNVDFEQIGLRAGQALYFRPGQVHSVPPMVEQVRGWFMAIDSSLVAADYVSLFESQFYLQKPVTLTAADARRLEATADLLQTSLLAAHTAYSGGIVVALANVLIGIIAEQDAASRAEQLQGQNRQAALTLSFKQLLAQNFKAWKSPTQYAKALNYSLAHLNESVKSSTGFPVSYWIQRQITLEAKRLLYYTKLEIKEIAFSLGYEDPSYFARLFTKIEGRSPGAFRNSFHEKS